MTRILGSAFSLLGTAAACLAMCAQLAVAQSMGSSITSESMFSWPVVVMFVGLAFTSAGAYTSLTMHLRRADLHPTGDALDARYQRRGECELTHQALMAKLSDIEAAVRALSDRSVH